MLTHARQDDLQSADKRPYRHTRQEEAGFLFVIVRDLGGLSSVNVVIHTVSGLQRIANIRKGADAGSGMKVPRGGEVAANTPQVAEIRQGSDEGWCDP